jgi:hypothetical protein
MLIQTKKKLTVDEQFLLEQALGLDCSAEVKDVIENFITREKENIADAKGRMVLYKSILSKLA